ncbi:MAG TPA: signal peptidase I [Bacteroidota bacterium]
MSHESLQIESQQVEQPVEPKLAVRVRAAIGYLKTVLITLLVALVLKAFVIEAFRIPSSSMERTLLVGDFLLVNKLAYGIRTPRFIPLTNFAVSTMYLPVFKNVQRGDVVVFEFPGNGESAETEEPVNYIKRCIGLPGDVVEIHDGQVYINSSPQGLPRNAQLSESNGRSSHYRSRLFPWGAGFTEQHYGPLVVPKKGDQLELTIENLSMWRSLILRDGHTVELGEGSRIIVDGVPAQSYTVEQNYYFVMGDNRDNSLDSRYWGFVPEDNLIGEALMVYWSWDPDVAVSNLKDKLLSIRWKRVGTMIR